MVDVWPFISPISFSIGSIGLPSEWRVVTLVRVDGESKAQARWTPISIGVMTFVVAISFCVVAYWGWLIARGPESRGESMYNADSAVLETNAVEGPTLD